MIKFNNEELKYIKKELNEVLKNKDDKEYKSDVGINTIVSAADILKLKNIEKINNNEILNKKCSEALYWHLSMWLWHENFLRHIHFTKEEVAEFVPDDEMYLNLYEKICCREDNEEYEEEFRSNESKLHLVN